MNSNVLKVGAVVTVILAIVLAALGFRVASRYAEQASAPPQQPPAPEPAALAVVALQPLPAQRPITADQVALIPVQVVPQQYFASTEDVVGRVPVVDIDAGAPLTPRYFADANVLARAIPDGHKAVSIEVDDVVAVGGFLRPGDTVDVLLYVRGATQDRSQTRRLLDGVRVLAYEERLVDRPEGVEAEAAGSRQRRRERTAVLAVPDDRLTRFVLGASLGNIRLAMHPQRLPDEVASGLPLDEEAIKRREADKVPGDAVTAEALLAIKPPPSQRKPPPPRPKVQVIRGSETEEVRP